MIRPSGLCVVSSLINVLWSPIPAEANDLIPREEANNVRQRSLRDYALVERKPAPRRRTAILLFRREQ
jgi:hypothetical protein